MSLSMKRVAVVVALVVSTVMGTSSIVSANKEGGACKKAGTKTGIPGGTLVCTRVTSGKNKGKLVWTRTSAGGGSGSSGSSGSGSSSSGQASLGGSCSESSGALKWDPIGVLVVCKGGKYKYAIPGDFPATPAGGYKSRPSWYPTITQILGGGKAEPTCSSSSIKFTHPVIPLASLTTTIPYGMMVSDHVTPIDHAYLGLNTLEIPESQVKESDYVSVTAPGDGTITELSSLGAPWTNRVTIDHGCGVYSVYMVLNRPTGVLAKYVSEMNAKGGYLKLSVPIKAGEVFGQQRDNALDFNVFDGSQWLSGFAYPASYLTGEPWKPYTADYLPFFSGAIRTAMENSLQRTTSPRIGKIDHDVFGSASGNWFLDGTFGYGGEATALYQNATGQIASGGVDGKNSYAWSHLSISPHEVDVDQWVFSVGWFTDPKGDLQQMILDVSTGKPAPSSLTASSGAVVYDLYQLSYNYSKPAGSRASAPVGYKLQRGQSKGQVILQVNADGSLSVEFGSAFTAAKRTYRR